MGAETLEDLELETGEDAVTADIPLTDPATLPEDLGDVAPPGEAHEVVPELDPALGLTDEDLPDLFPVAGVHLAPIGLNARDRIRARDLAVRPSAGSSARPRTARRSRRGACGTAWTTSGSRTSPTARASRRAGRGA